MRTDNDIYRAIQDYVRADDNIRAAILNGSRANKQVAADKYQDFDIVFFVRDIDTAKISPLRESFSVFRYYSNALMTCFWAMKVCRPVRRIPC